MGVAAVLAAELAAVLAAELIPKGFRCKTRFSTLSQRVNSCISLEVYHISVQTD